MTRDEDTERPKLSDPAHMNATIATETRWPGSLQRMVRLLGETDRITAEWRKKHDAILREVGQAMRAERERRKMSLRELARRLAVSAPFLSDMERGNRKYSIEWCKKAMSAMQPNKELDKVLDSFAHTEGLLPAHVHTGAIIPATSERAVFEIAGLAYREPWER